MFPTSLFEKQVDLAADASFSEVALLSEQQILQPQQELALASVNVSECHFAQQVASCLVQLLLASETLLADN